MVETGSDANNIFIQVENIHISDMNHQAHGYFGILGIRNDGNEVLTNPLVVSALLNLTGSAQE